MAFPTAPLLARGFPQEILAVAVGGSPTLALYQARNLTKMGDVHPLPSGAANSVAFSPNGRTVALGTNASPYLTLYDLPSRAKLPDPGGTPASAPNRMRFSPDGSRLAVPYAGVVRVYDTADWSTVQTLNPGAASFVAWSRDGAYLAMGSRNYSSSGVSLRVYDTATWTALPAFSWMPDKDVASISFNDTHLAIQTYDAVLTGDRSIYVYQISDWSSQQIYNYSPAVGDSTEVQNIQFSRDGAWLAYVRPTATPGKVLIFETSGWTLAQTLAISEDTALSMDFNAGGNIFAVQASSGGVGSRIYFYRVPSWAPLAVASPLTDYSTAVSYIAFGPKHRS